LQTERDALLGLLEKADQLSDVLQVQEQLTKVRHELDSLEAQLRLLDDQIDLSTITLDIIEVERVSPDQPQGFWRQIGQNLKENLFSIGRGAKALFAWLISALPYFALGAVPAVVLALLLRRAYRSRKAKRSQKQ
ncbi:MAG: DUF4349 domain-containing protein, partial [Oscillospiraceae bacterium]|nr:DUF4349 domain-containing protein [Oscillospiraceae bacterium]